jgi:hypothetical protein
VSVGGEKFFDGRQSSKSPNFAVIGPVLGGFWRSRHHEVVTVFDDDSVRSSLSMGEMCLAPQCGQSS